MKRVQVSPRVDWEKKVVSNGLVYYKDETGRPYWNEGAYYQFTEKEILLVESATKRLQEMCLEAAQHIIDNNLFHKLSISSSIADLIKWCWDEEPPAIYGRFDLAFDGVNPPKLLEYNADTPTSLLEASVIQWFWLQEKFPEKDQFNSIHERLIEKWKELNGYLIQKKPLYFTSLDDREDIMTVSYLRETAEQAGIETRYIKLQDIGWNGDCFVDLGNHEMRSIFKLYPWEWLVAEDFGKHLLDEYRSMQWMEPIWKMLFSNKGILPILWEMYPGDENLLEAYFDSPCGLEEYVKKPLLSREGSNISIVTKDRKEESFGDYGEEGYVYQKYSQLPCFNGNYPVIGSWVVDGLPCGMGIRESDNLITDNMARFVPHLFF